MDTTFQQFITFLQVKDLNRASEFYEKKLGLKLVVDQGDCRIYRIAQSAYIGFCQRGRLEDQQEARIILTLIVENVDEWHQKLSAEGVTFETPPTYSPKYQIYHCFLKDPDGYLIEVQRFDHPLPNL